MSIKPGRSGALPTTAASWPELQCCELSPWLPNLSRQARKVKHGCWLTRKISLTLDVTVGVHLNAFQSVATTDLMAVQESTGCLLNRGATVPRMSHVHCDAASECNESRKFPSAKESSQSIIGASSTASTFATAFQHEDRAIVQRGNPSEPHHIVWTC